jgi:hypothetical protein
MAAPHVTGVVALLYARNPALTFSQVLSLLQNTVTSFPVGSTCSTSLCGSGILNAGAAVAAALPPVAFSKSAPANGATGLNTTVTLAWDGSAGADTYEYCLDTSNNQTCNANWIGTGTATATNVSNLTPGTTYYWLVHAQNLAGTTDANAGAWWSFTPQPVPPAAFNKASPVTGAAGQPTDLLLSWSASSAAERYEYCLDTSANNACNTTWVNAGFTTSIPLSNLAPATTYSWQVRAINGGGSTDANSSAWASFTTRAPFPGEFNKAAPLTGAGALPVTLTLSWNASSLATGYEYCVDSSPNNTCDTAWESTTTTTSAEPGDLAAGQTYYWQVRALTSGSPIYSNDSVWWSFSIAPPIRILLPLVVR